MRVLIAEDEPVSRHLLKKLLVQWGYDVEVASDGDEAWWTLEKDNAPKLAILDWMMPGMDGANICRELRKRAGTPYIYVLMLTAKAQKGDIVEGLEAGADDYVTKPFDAEELRVRLRAGRRIVDLQDHLIAIRDAALFPTTHDSLTGVWNREAILATLRRELSRQQRQHKPLGLILVNVDLFRVILNNHGPLAAEGVLREVAQRMRSSVRMYDSVGRYGGKEFLVLAPGCDFEAVEAQAERIRSAIAGDSIDILSGAIPVTVSMAVATSEQSSDAPKLLRMLEDGVYRAKRAGRNRVEVAVNGNAETQNLPLRN